MTEPEDPAGKDLLARIALGELRPDAPEVVACRGRDPAFAVAVDELVRTLAALNAAGAEERAWLADATASGAADLRPGLVADTIARLAAESGPTARPVGRRWRSSGMMVLTAAVVLVAAWLALRPPDGPRPDDRPLGDKHLSLLEERFDADAVILEWESDLDGARFVVSIWVAEDPTRRPLLEQETKELRWRIEANEWRPLKALGQALRWRVVASRGSFTTDKAGDLSLPR